MLQLHLSDHQFYCQLRRNLYQRFDGMFYTRHSNIKVRPWTGLRINTRQTIGYLLYHEEYWRALYSVYIIHEWAVLTLCLWRGWPSLTQTLIRTRLKLQPHVLSDVMLLRFVFITRLQNNNHHDRILGSPLHISSPLCREATGLVDSLYRGLVMWSFDDFFVCWKPHVEQLY